jgi:hypothetical protein
MREHQELHQQEQPQERLRRLRTEAFTRLVNLWSRLSPEHQRRRLGWLVGQCDVEGAEMLIRYCEAKEGGVKSL